MVDSIDVWWNYPMIIMDLLNIHYIKLSHDYHVWWFPWLSKHSDHQTYIKHRSGSTKRGEVLGPLPGWPLQGAANAGQNVGWKNGNPWKLVNLMEISIKMMIIHMIFMVHIIHKRMINDCWKTSGWLRWCGWPWTRLIIRNRITWANDFEFQLSWWSIYYHMMPKKWDGWCNNLKILSLQEA